MFLRATLSYGPQVGLYRHGFPGLTHEVRVLSYDGILLTIEEDIRGYKVRNIFLMEVPNKCENKAIFWIAADKLHLSRTREGRMKLFSVPKGIATGRRPLRSSTSSNIGGGGGPQHSYWIER